MRESRQSGSVEGVMGNHHSYSDFLGMIGLLITSLKTGCRLETVSRQTISIGL